MMWIEVLLHPGDFNKGFDPRSKKENQHSTHIYTQKKANNAESFLAVHSICGS